MNKNLIFNISLILAIAPISIYVFNVGIHYDFIPFLVLGVLGFAVSIILVVCLIVLWETKDTKLIKSEDKS